MAKVELRNKARDLRKQGLSLKDIVKNLNISKSTASVWVRDIDLSNEQKAKLCLRNAGGSFGTAAIKKKHATLRKRYRDEGKALAKTGDELHMKGCMLYWGEGTKNRNVARIGNTDPDLLKLWSDFVKRHYTGDPDRVYISVRAYSDNGKNAQEIQEYWLNLLGLKESNLRKITFDCDKRSRSKNKHAVHTYGICDLGVCDTQFVQQIFGAICEYAGVDSGSKFP